MSLVHVTTAASFRSNAEDRILVEELNGARLIVVADGAGGIPGGDRAAEMLVAHVRRRVVAAAAEQTPAFWVTLLREADRLVATDSRAGETTGIALVIDGESVVGASAGDSEAWLVSADSRVVLTAKQQRKRRIGGGNVDPVAFEGSMRGCTLLVATDGLFGYARPSAICQAVRDPDLATAAQRLVQIVRLPGGGFMDDLAITLVRAATGTSAIGRT
jgi:serine/threonine protein phosphatase PrpC